MQHKNIIRFGFIVFLCKSLNVFKGFFYYISASLFFKSKINHM